MPLEEQILSPDSPPFTIRHFVSTIRGKNFSRCWPFPQRILERCLILGMKVELPPLEPPSIGNSCNIKTEMPLNECSEKVVSCGCSRGSSKENFTNSDSGDSLEVLMDPATEKVYLCDTEVLSFVEKKVVVDMREQFSSIQKPDATAVAKSSAETFWDDNAVSSKTDISSKSGSHSVVDALSNSVGLVVTGKAGFLHVESENAATMEVPDCGPFHVIQENTCTPHTSQSGEPVEPCNTPSIHSNQSVLDSLKPSPFETTYHEKHQGDRKAVCQPVVPLAAVEPMGCSRKTEGSNSDASMPQVCPVCLKFSSTSNTALNAHIDHCLVVDETVARPCKKRVRIKKMRSMVDIYALAPARTLEDLEMSSQFWSSRKA